MVRPVFITGAGGFVGQRLLPELAARGVSVIALDRSGRLAPGPGLEVVRGDLLDPASYRDALARCGLILHMAAATGRASRDEHFRINLAGTERLLEESARAGIAGFLFVSSIATTFSNLTNYHYAQAKAQAEERVRRSGLASLIVRPTMILGSGAPILTSLEKLALLPVAVLPGNGRALVQPIHVDDVVVCLVRAIETGAFSNETIAIGGADRISIEQLLRQLRAARRGVTGPLVHFPLPLLQIPLSLAEAVGLGRLLPITAGQLSSFRFDGVSEPNRLQPPGQRLAPLPDLFETAPAVTRTPQGPLQPSAELDVECRTFTRYLAGQPASDYVQQKYRDAHASSPQLRAANRSDEVLVRFARRGPLFAKLADAHAALLAPASLLRKKLVLLLAILETCPPYYRTIDAPVGGSPVPAFFRLVGIGLVSIACLVLGSLALIPMRILGGGKPGVRS